MVMNFSSHKSTEFLDQVAVSFSRYTVHHKVACLVDMFKGKQCYLVVFQVAQQCKENIFAIQTLKDFQYFEESKDQGMNVREKAKQLVLLLKDDERLRNERARALKAKERFAQAASGFGSEGTVSEISLMWFVVWNMFAVLIHDSVSKSCDESFIF
jgi:hypothetical protein